MAAILSGPGALAGRGPNGTEGLLRAVLRLTGRAVTRVAWEEVAEITSAVKLRRTAGELGLGRGDDAAGRLVGRLPWA